MLPISSYFDPKKFASFGYLSKLAILGIDLTFSLVSYLFAILITCKFDLVKAVDMVGWVTLILLALRGWSFVIFKTYLIIARYVGEKDYKNIFYAVTFSSTLFAVLLYFIPGVLPAREVMPVVVVDFLILFTLACGFRILMRLVFDRIRMHRRSRINTVIFGAGELGSMLMRVLKHNDSHDYRVVAFFDDDPKVSGKMLNGVKIFNPEKSFKEVVKKYDIKVAIIGINGLSEERRVAFINRALDHQLKILKVPPTENWLNDNLNIGQLTDIRFEDLLNRPPIRLDEQRVSESIQGKVVMVTGCAGSIGSEIVRQLLKYQPKKLIGLDIAETPLADISLSLKKESESGLFQTIIGDVRDYEKMERIFRKYRPSYVFHAAAYKHVPIMERFPAEAVKANVLGTVNIASLASECGVEKFVMVSTDKAVKPGNIMGASKRIAEIFVQSLNYQKKNTTQFITTRFGNVLGSNGSVIPIFKRQIETRQPVTVTHPDVTRYFMTIPEACQLVLEAGAMGKGGEIYVFDMGKPVKIVELATKMIQMAGLTVNKDIPITFTGLRPGEKLYEELLDKQEDAITTHHPKIRKASVRAMEYLEVNPKIEGLIDMAQSGYPNLELVKRMKEIVPEFTSQNSTFAKLDKNGSHPGV
jgi:FlaA1/EpsC-like NDP-sugar epimerase